MRDPPVSILERSFVLEAMSSGKRLDGRAVDEHRPLSVSFGTDYGRCMVTVGGAGGAGGAGSTTAVASVTCAVTEPSDARPNEGRLVVAVEFSPTAAPRCADGGYAASDNADTLTELCRLLERCLVESRCVDMESLCIVSEQQVWTLRLEVVMLDDGGNCAAAAALAGLAALAHFRRPDVTLKGDKVTVHPVSERDPVPLAIHHYPVCSTFAFFKSGDETAVCVDPTWQEEAIMDGKIVFGVNSYREICTLHLAGKMIIDKTIILRHANAAAQHAKSVVEMLKSRLAEDAALRTSGHLEDVGLAKALHTHATILTNASNAEEDKVVDEEMDQRISDFVTFAKMSSSGGFGP